MDERNATRNAYIETLRPLGFVPQKIGSGTRHNVQSMVFRVPPSVNRDAMVAELKAVGIETTLGTYCQSGTTYFREKYSSVQPNSAELEATTLTVPCYTGVPVKRVAQEISRLVV